MFGLYYNERLAQIQFWILFIGSNCTFMPLHFLGLQALPRRYPNYPDAYYGWNLVSSFGSIISTISVILFFYIIYDQLVNGLNNKHFFNNPDFVESNIIHNKYNNNKASSLEWASNNPAPLHSYNSTPIM